MFIWSSWYFTKLVIVCLINIKYFYCWEIGGGGGGGGPSSTHNSNNHHPSNQQYHNNLINNNNNNNNAIESNYYLNKPIFSYVGCFNDRRELRDVGDKDYTFITKFNKSIPTVELCVLLCAQDGYSIAGIQAFDECYCGNNYGRYNATDDTNCFFQCAGKYTCGGYNANSVYLISVKQSSNKEVDRSLAVNVPKIPNIPNNLPSIIQQNSLNNPCLSSPCLNSGMCITLMDDKGIPRGYLCRCTNPQDSGAFCEDRNFCFSNPCLNGGSCTNTLNGYSCKCGHHWTGFNCNIPSNIMPTTVNCFDASKRCLNGGSCAKFPNELDYSCKCPHNYGGTQCEIFDVCAKRPCLHEGVCTFKPPQYYECKCVDGYYGANCERPNPCKNASRCANGAKCQIDFKNLGDYYCACEGNFQGKHCNQCKPQFAGKYCDRCVEGFTGSNCDVLINRCLPSPCGNGICVMDGSSYKCICTEGWKGKNCTEKNCLLKPCVNEGVCTAIYENVTNQIEYKCICPVSVYGEQCQLKDDLSTNNKTEIDTSRISRSLIRIARLSEGESCIRSKCLNQGICVHMSDINSIGFKCICENNFTGFFCETNLKSDQISENNETPSTIDSDRIDFCTSQTCGSNGTCININNKLAHCLCQIPYYGDKCQFKDHCYSNPCELNKYCQQLPNNSYVCKESRNNSISGSLLLTSLSSSTSYHQYDSNGDVICPKNYCNSNGVCKINKVSNKTLFFCSCNPLKTGIRCESDTNPCLSNPCKASEDCIQSTDSPTSYYCVQSMNICERIRPCNENSECIYSRENNTFYCRCLNGAAGCDTVYISSTPTASVVIPESTFVVPKILSGEVVNNAQSNSRPQTEIPKFGFNYDNLYLILPVALVVLVVVFFSSIVIYFGFKARSRTAKFNKKETNIRNIHYINENMTFDENLKPIPSGSNSSIGFSNSDKEYNEGYGRV